MNFCKKFHHMRCSHISGANGSATTIEVVQPPMTSHSSSNTEATSRNVNSIRKTLAKWLRLQRPNSKNDVKKENHGRSRYKLTGNTCMSIKHVHI